MPLPDNEINTRIYRKCGRVVCGNCSSSKSTYMPATYVVSPPSQIFLESPHVPHRTCDECMEELEMIRAALRARPSYDRHGSSRNRRRSSAPHGNGSTNGGTVHEHYRRASSALTGPPILFRGSSRYHGGGDSSSQISGGDSSISPKGYDESMIQTISVGYDEDDENTCPICGRNLTKYAENDKESHIADCLQRAEFSGEQQRRNNRMLIYQIPKEKVVSDSPTPSPSEHSTPTLAVSEPLPGPTSHGECVICFEDFEPGDTVGRLECLCIYHEKCILDWFKRKGAGSCPVHAVHS